MLYTSYWGLLFSIKENSKVPERDVKDENGSSRRSIFQLEVPTTPRPTSFV
jgi:hypothetical protein